MESINVYSIILKMLEYSIESCTNISKIHNVSFIFKKFEESQSRKEKELKNFEK